MNKQPKKNLKQSKSHNDILAATLIQRAYRSYVAQKELTQRKQLYARKTNIAKELLSTEVIYVANLRCLALDFLERMQNARSDILGAELNTKISLLFGIVKVILSYHVVILSHLEERISDWGPSTMLGDIFMEMSSYLKTYTQYVTHYQPAVQLLKVKKDDVEVNNYLNSFMTPECKGKGLKDFLIMPVQRIPRYNMMLADLLNRTWSGHQDRRNLRKAAKKIKSVCEHVEKMSEEALRLQKKMEIAQKVVFQKKSDITLAVAYRKFLWEDSVSFQSTPPSLELISLPNCWMVSFTDLLLFCEEPNKNDKYRVVSHILFDKIRNFQSILVKDKEGLIIETETSRVVIQKNERSNTDLLKLLNSQFSERALSGDRDESVTKGKTIHVKRVEMSEPLPAPTLESVKPTEERSARMLKSYSLKNLKRSFSSSPKQPRKAPSGMQTLRHKVRRQASFAEFISESSKDDSALPKGRALQQSASSGLLPIRKKSSASGVASLWSGHNEEKPKR